MKKFLCASLVFALSLMMIPQACATVSLNAFPDSVFREYLKQFDTGYYDSDVGDTIGADDDILADIELERITSLTAQGNEWSSLEGIKHLTSLTTLRLFGTSVKELDISGMKNFDSLECMMNDKSDKFKSKRFGYIIIVLQR